MERIVKGGFSGLLNKSLSQAMEINRSYVDLLAEVDISRVSDVKRSPGKVRSLLRSLSRNIATTVDITVLEKDIKLNENTDISRPAIYDYLEALIRLMIMRTSQLGMLISVLQLLCVNHLNGTFQKLHLQ